VGSSGSVNPCLTLVRKRLIQVLMTDVTLTPLPMTLTKRDLVIRISEETGLIQQQVLTVVQKTLDYIAEALAKGDKVELRNFGVFEVKVRKARIGRNPNAPATDVPIPERSVVKFKPGKEMRGEVIKIPPRIPAKVPPQPPQPTQPAS
jgi:nucleoid DNA-binding protein